MPTALKGIRRHGRGWEVRVTVHGISYCEQFPLTATTATMRAWQDDHRRRTPRDLPATAGSFYADILADLPRIAASPTAGQQEDHLRLWADALGRDRPTHTITSAEIDVVIQQMLVSVPCRRPAGRRLARGDTVTTIRAARPGEPTLAPETVRKRRTSLYGFFRRRGGPNPVESTMIPRAPEEEARGLDYRDIARILAAMPDLQSTAPGDPPRPNLSKLIADVMAHTGVPPALLRQVAPDFVHLGLRQVQFPPRKKGKGARGRTLPLLPMGVAAFARFAAAGRWGSTWSPAAVNVANRSFQHACAAVADACVAPADVRRATLYWLRHSFGYFLYETTHDLATVRRMLMLETLAMAERYAGRANASVDRAAAEHMGMRMAALLGNS